MTTNPKFCLLVEDIGIVEIKISVFDKSGK